MSSKPVDATDPKGGSARSVWLFSDLMEPASTRPMFGCLLMKYDVSNPLHRARTKALSRLDGILESPKRKGDRRKAAGLGSLETIKELTACVQWLLDQSMISWTFPDHVARDGRDSLSSKPHPFSTGVLPGHSEVNTEWLLFWDSKFPTDSVERHFALRAAFCVLAAGRPLNVSELFAASTTTIKPGDPVWPWNSESRSEQLIRLTQSFLDFDKRGQAHVRSADLVSLFARENSIVPHEAHAFLACVCLKHLQEMAPRIIIWPWSCYLELRDQPDHYPLHEYVTNFWQYHYGQAELYMPDIPRQLHKMIEGVWISERTEMSVQSGMGREVELSAYTEALDVGLVLCEAYGFKKLESAYINMGAREHGSSKHDSFDFSDWYKVEPLHPL